jgi:hypothetical protein
MMRTIFALFSLFAILHSASAAEFRSFTAKDGRVLVSVVGEIAEGDADRFKAAIKSANDAGKFVANIRLNSIGGNLLEGVKLADAVRFAKIATNVGKNGTCASACFLVFAAGATKFANYTARIGVHGASTRTGEEAGDATVSMARVAKELGVPSAIIGRMVVTPPSEIIWLSPQELQSMGTTMVGKPEQTAAEPGPPRQIAPDEPPSSQSEPTARASTKSWSDMVKSALSRSASQNGGTPRTVRGCQPELKLCFNAVMFVTGAGKEASLKVTKDANDKVIGREFCVFNSSNDIRDCIDWDKGTARKDMKDMKDHWQQIE